MLSKRIDVAELKELASARAVIEPQLDVRRFSRLAELLGDPEQDHGGVELGIGIEQAREGIARLRIDLKGELPLRCQRCLQTVVWPIRLRTRLTVVSDDREAEALTEPFDSVILEDGELRLETVVEDEILAALPMAPTHESGEACESAGTPITDSEKETEQTYRPFESLANLVGEDRKE